MPLLKTHRPCFFLEADAYILIHYGNSPDRFPVKNVFRRAGPQMLEAYQNAGLTLYGDPVITPGFSLNAKYVIHILQPGVWKKEPVTKEQYRKALLLAQAYHCESVVFSMPPYYEEIRKVNSECRSFIQESDMTIYLSGSADSVASLSDNLLARLKSFLKDDFVGEDSSSASDYLSSDNSESIPVHLEENLALGPDGYLTDLPVHEDDGDCAILIEESTDQRARIRGSRPLTAEPKMGGEFQAIWEFLKQNDAGFKDTLLKYIDRTGKKDSEIYKKANVDRRLFSKIMNVQGYNPSKPTAIAFAIALELNLEETKDLIGRAGYTLSQASTFDRIIEFFITERNYDIYEINEALFYFDQSLLGC